MDLGNMRDMRSFLQRAGMLLASGIFVAFVCLGLYFHWIVTDTSYNIPLDSICFFLEHEETGSLTRQVSEFRFVVYLENDMIWIWSHLIFANESRPHHLDIYLPFPVYEIHNKSYGNVTVRYHTQSPCSLINIDIPAESSRNCYISLDIYVHRAWAVKRMGEKTVILTFGYPNSAPFDSLGKEVRQPSSDLLAKYPIKVTVGAEKGSFLSEISPDSDVESLRGNNSFASWQIQHAGPFANFYRSVHCTSRNPDELTRRQTLTFASPLLISVGTSLFIAIVVKTYFDRLKVTGRESPSHERCSYIT